MDISIIIALASGLIILVLLYFVLKERKKVRVPIEDAQPGRRVANARNARARLRAAAAQVEDEEEKEDIELEKLGAKKRAKLEAKAEKKAQRENEERLREEEKKRKEHLEAERKKQEEKELLDEQKKAEEEKKAKEEKERQEHEEYMKLKASFSVEETGFGDTDISEDSNLLQEFISHIKNTKVILMEDLAAKFSMKTQSVIDRIMDLQTEGRLTGVIDDRGKFIYISQNELEGVAKFVKQRGRVSLSELVENSQRLVSLNPVIST